MRSISGIASDFLFDRSDFSCVLVIDVTTLLTLREGDEPDLDVLNDEALLAQFGKRLEKPVIRFLERLHLRNATIVARGALCQFALKTLSSAASRALSRDNIKTIVLLHPVLKMKYSSV